MAYVNQGAPLDAKLHPAPDESKRTQEKLRSMAMTNFVEPTVLRAYKVKSPLTSVSSVLFHPLRVSSTSGDPQQSDALTVADLTAGKIVQFDASNGRCCGDLVADVDPHDICTCGSDYLVVVDSNEWGSCIKVVTVDGGQVLATWGREFSLWTPRAITATNNEQLVVSNVHPQASSRLALFTPDGRQVSQFGRAVGPGDLVFRSPVSLAYDVTSGRIFAADPDTGCVKIFDARCNYSAEFGGNISTSGQRSPKTGNGNDCVTLDNPVSVCCDGLGNAVVCDSGSKRVMLFSRDGRYLCNLIDFQKATGSPRWQLGRRHSDSKEVVPVCVGLSSPGRRIAVSLENRLHGFRKLVVHSVSPEL